jgi:pimeloyl-ACP methyl ester carboxylesterase
MMDLSSSHRKVDLVVAVSTMTGKAESGRIVATAYLPPPRAIKSDAAVLFLFPGAYYGRGYFDLPSETFSQATAHVAAGIITITVDHLGVGDSSLPDREETTISAVAEANHQAMSKIINALIAGTLTHNYPPIAVSAVVGAGHSMGGFIVTAMQALNRSFDGVAVMGASMVATRLPRRPGLVTPIPPANLSPDEQMRFAFAGMGRVDWRWALHWDDNTTTTALIERDVEAGFPQRVGTEPWVSHTTPGCFDKMLSPGAITAEASVIDVPVLLATGERDVCQPPLIEAGAFPACRDLSIYVCPRMAHMHNFAPTRHRLWARLEAFVNQVCCLKLTTEDR